MHGTNFSKTKYCPYCMSRLTDGEICPVCGLTRGNYLPQPHHLPPGTVLVDRYMVGRVLGEGGFGITYIGRDMRLDYRVAIKEYLPSDQVSRNTEIALDVTRYATVSEEAYEKGLQRFLNEARTLALMFKQPQIVTVHDFFEANGTAYIVMEYVDGTTFAELVKQYGGRIAPEELFPMIEPLFGALANVHKQGILHRDISPDNLMLENGNVRLLDFGSARQVQPTGQQTMTIALKKGYGPIEQYQGKGQGPWTDVYALSATIYYCLTGVKPPDAVERILDDELVPPRELGVDMPQWQEQALLYGMSVNPTKRYRTMDAMHAGLYLPPADTIVPSPAVLGGVAVLEAGFAPEEAQAQALSQAEALLQTEEQMMLQEEASQLAEENVTDGSENTNTIMQDDLVTGIRHLNKDGIDISEVNIDDANSSVVPREQQGREKVSNVPIADEANDQEDAAITDTENKDKKEHFVTIGSQEEEEGTVLSNFGEAVEQPIADNILKEETGETRTDKRNGAQPVAASIEEEDGQTATYTQGEYIVEEPVTADRRGGFFSYYSTHRSLAITAGVVLVAVVALAIVLAVLIPRSGSDDDPTQVTNDDGQDDDGQDGNGEAAALVAGGQDEATEQEPETEEPFDYDALFTSTVRYDASTFNDTGFRNELALAKVSSISLSGNIEFTDGDLVIDKPVLVEWYGSLEVYSHVTVTGDGVLYVKGSVTVNGMMDVTDGGQIVVADGGELDVDGLLWLQDEDSCVLQDGSALVLEGETYTSIADAALERSLLVLDEDALFANARHVTSTGEFRDTYNQAIVIDADMTFTEAVDQTAPVMISEGVTVTMADDTYWDNHENVFINYGAFLGSYYAGEWIDDDEDGMNDYNFDALWRVLNYGELQLDVMWCRSWGTVVNNGQFVIDGGEDVPVISNSVFCNLGEFGNSESELRFCNYGVCNCNCQQIYDMNWDRTSSVLNMGEIHIAGGGEFTNEAYMENRGTITVEDGATMQNNAVIVSNSSSSSIIVSPDGEWRGYGTVIYSSGSTLDLQGAAEEIDASLSFRFSENEDDLENVYTADQLVETLASGETGIVAVGGNIIYEGNLDVRDCVLVLKKGSSLTVDGDVTATGGDAAIYLRGGTLDMGDHTLTLSDSAILQLGTDGEGGTMRCGTLDIKEGCRVMAAEEWSAEGMHLIEERYGSVVNLVYGISLRDCTVDIGEEAFWYCNSDSILSMTLSSTTMNVAGNAWFHSSWGRVDLDADTVVTIAESGWLEMRGWNEITVTLDGTIENYGDLRISWTNLKVQSTGILNNYHCFGGVCQKLHLAGILNNEGEIAFGDESELIREGGSYSGDDPVEAGEDYSFW